MIGSGLYKEPCSNYPEDSELNNPPGFELGLQVVCWLWWCVQEDGGEESSDDDDGAEEEDVSKAAADSTKRRAATGVKSYKESSAVGRLKASEMVEVKEEAVVASEALALGETGGQHVNKRR